VVLGEWWDEPSVGGACGEKRLIAQMDDGRMRARVARWKDRISAFCAFIIMMKMTA